MTPPKAPMVDLIDAGDTPSAALSFSDTESGCAMPRPAFETLKTRPDFLRTARARRQAAGSMMVQARRRDADEPPGAEVIRVGYTCSKKVGNAVARNRAKRRLREAARAVIPQAGRAGWDYVLIGWTDVTANRPFDLLKQDLEGALTSLHSKKKPPAKRKPARSGT